ncbi:hypothetical protein CAPTEDRAFT_209440 [Capitella teleta]|uniref:Uncharacterized protein n=1 Tax=Capitella teleta TaxID=283909 RepID=R7UMI6_CAPTE|nr:hypothetical protein CAPTEDRAFT_209440 [Capitella teleta]|eukprot:ELU07440.1 hypothetical protein CAPTEDRAFT_209440 [Capitella teleta]
MLVSSHVWTCVTMTTPKTYAVLLAGTSALLLADVVIICAFFNGFSDLFTNKASDALLWTAVAGTISVDALSNWLLVYLFQIPWLIYGFSGLFRRYKGQAFCISAPVISAEICLLFSISSFLNFVWMVCVDRHEIIAGTIVMFVSSFLLFTCVGLSLNSLNVFGPDLLFDGHMKDIRIVRMFVQNFIGLFATWANIVALVDFSMILHYNLGVSEPTATLTVQVALLLEMLAIFGVDVFLLKHHSRFFFAVYARIALDALSCLIKESNSFGEITGIRTTIFIIANGMFVTKGPGPWIGFVQYELPLAVYRTL